MRDGSVAKRWAVLMGAWLAVSFFAVGSILLSWRMLGIENSLGVLLRLELPVWFFWVPATVLAVRLSRRHPLDRSRRRSSIVVHLVVAAVTAALFVSYRMVWYQAFNPSPYLDPYVLRWFWRMFREHFVSGFTLYWAVVGVYHAFTNYSRLVQRELEASVMRGQLAEARLESLRLQLRPHFLFNALNTASAVLEQNPRRARRIIGRLGDLLRASLRTDGSHLVPLAEELDLVAAYLEIEQERFGGRLSSEVDVPPELGRVLVPGFILQPLVENAIRHGIAPREGPGHVVVRARRRGDLLEVQVEDDGVGLPQAAVREGIGLGNTRRRLGELYGPVEALSLRPKPGGGLDVRLLIPLSPATGKFVDGAA